jgi:HD-GYP domain-containing protein (c-di-GMP phosphodiesterase class II)
MSKNNSVKPGKIFRNDMRRQFVVAMVLVAVIPLTVLSVGLYYFNIFPLLTSFINFNKNLLDRQLISEQVVLTRKYAERLNNFFRDLDIQTSVLSGIADGHKISLDNQQEMIREYLKRFPHIRWMSSVSGLQVGLSTPAMQDIFEKALADEIALRSVGNNGMRISSPLRLDNHQNETFLVVSVPAFIESQGRNLFLVRLPTADYLLRDEPFEGSIIVVDELGHIVIQSRELDYTYGVDFSHTPMVSSFINSGSAETAFNFRGMDNVLHRGVLSRVGFMNWGLITQRKPVNLTGVMLETEAAAHNLMKRLVLAAVIGVISAGLLAGSIGALIAFRFTRPLQNILTGINVVAQGDFSYTFEESGPEDIQHLTRTLNSMIDSIQSYTHELNQHAENIKKMFLGSVSSLVAAIDAKDPYTRGHSRRVQNISVAIGRQMGLSGESLDELEISALMHDIGKLGINEDLLKKPGFLSNEERMVIESHPVLGGEIVRHIPMFQNMLSGILYHHERWDGSGYPEGRIGKAIPLYGRIVAVADTFDAMTSSRPYQDAISHEDAKDQITGWSGIRYDPVVVQAFVEVFPEVVATCNTISFPAGFSRNSV